MTCGVYAITNMTDGKVYIGRSVHIEKRWKEHIWYLSHHQHANRYFQEAWNKGDEFELSIIEKCDKEFLNAREIYWIARYKATDRKYGYNMCEGGISTTGRICTEETRKKISESNKGRKCDREVVEQRKKSLNKHMKEDPEFAEYIRTHRFQKGHNAGKKPPNYGVPVSEETRRKLSIAGKGKKKPKSQGEKLRIRFSGEKSNSAKLKERDVVQIRLRFLSGERQCLIRRDYPNITPQTIYDICRNRRWQSVPNTIEELEEMERRYEHSRDWQQAD